MEIRIWHRDTSNLLYNLFFESRFKLLLVFDAVIENAIKSWILILDDKPRDTIPLRILFCGSGVVVFLEYSVLGLPMRLIYSHFPVVKSIVLLLFWYMLLHNKFPPSLRLNLVLRRTFHEVFDVDCSWILWFLRVVWLGSVIFFIEFSLVVEDPCVGSRA